MLSEQNDSHMLKDNYPDAKEQAVFLKHFKAMKNEIMPRHSMITRS